MSVAAAPANQRSLVVSVAAIAFVAFNVLFYVMSASYVESHQAMTGTGGLDLGALRMSFAAFSLITAGGVAAGAFAPRVVGHAAAVVLGGIHLVGAAMAWRGGATGVVTVTLLLSGALLPTLAHFSWRWNRPAWAFMTALCGVFGIVELFASPKIRGALGVGLWTTMILPGLNLVAVWALASLRDRYARPGGAA